MVTVQFARRHGLATMCAGFIPASVRHHTHPYQRDRVDLVVFQWRVQLKWSNPDHWRHRNIQRSKLQLLPFLWPLRALGQRYGFFAIWGWEFSGRSKRTAAICVSLGTGGSYRSILSQLDRRARSAGSRIRQVETKGTARCQFE